MLFALALVLCANTKKVAVVEIAARDFSANQADLFNELAQKDMRAHGLQVISKSDIEAMLGLERMKSLTGCDSTSCLAEIGGALGADEIVTGAIGKVGDIVVMTLKRIDPKRSAVIKQAVRQVDADSAEGFVFEVPFIVAELFGWEPPARGSVSTQGRKSSRVIFQTDDSYDVQVVQGFRTYRCPKAVTKQQPCTLNIEPGEATVVVAGAYQELRTFEAGETTYRVKWRPRWPWITMLVAGPLIGAAGIVNGVLLATPVYCHTSECASVRSGWIGGGTAFAAAAIVGGVVGLIFSGNLSTVTHAGVPALGLASATWSW